MVNEKILVVEDEAITATDIKFKLEDMEYEVVGIAETGEKAIDLTTELRPDLVLMDITLKGDMTGIEALQKILALDVPVIYLTAHSDDETFLKANENLPASGYVIKPFDEKKFQRTIKLALNRQSIESKKVNVARGVVNKKPPEMKKEKSSKPQPPKKEKEEEKEENRKTKILVVEDEVITALDIQLKLQDFGFDVPKTASSGKETLEYVEEIKPDLILMDIMLKGEMNGIEITDKLKHKNIPIVYLTANTDNEVIESALCTSPYGYISKPFTDHELKHGVIIALKKHEANLNKIAKVTKEVKTKNKEIEVEQMSLLFFIGIIGVAILWGIYTKFMIWFEIILLIPAIFSLIILFGGYKHKKNPKEFEKNPFITIMIPTYNNEDTIETTIKNFKKLDYTYENKDNYEIIVINDGSTDKTGEILSNLKKEIDNLKIVTRKLPRAREGKAYTLNEGLKIAKGEAIAIFDSTSYIKPDFLKKTVHYLNEDGVKAVQAKIQTNNPKDNFLTSMQNIENLTLSNILKSEDLLGKSGTLGENGSIIMKDAIEEIGDWDSFASTEDLNIGIKLLMKGYKICYTDETSVYQHAVTSWKKYFQLRTQWHIGKIETLFIYFEELIKSKISLMQKILSLEYLLRGILRFFLYIGVILFILEITKMRSFGINPLILGIILIVAFIPNLIRGLNKEEGIGKAIAQTTGYWIFSFITIPIFIYSLIKLVRKENKGTVYYRSS